MYFDLVKQFKKWNVIYNDSEIKINIMLYQLLKQVNIILYNHGNMWQCSAVQTSASPPTPFTCGCILALLSDLIY